VTANEIVDKVRERLELWGPQGASMHQEPFKGDLFKLCKAAHAGRDHDITSSPRLTNEGLRDALLGRWKGNVDQNVRKLRKPLEDLCRMWGEWLYALERA
jgi:hypothetical protein